MGIFLEAVAAFAERVYGYAQHFGHIFGFEVQSGDGQHPLFGKGKSIIFFIDLCKKARPNLFKKVFEGGLVVFRHNDALV